MTFTVTNVRVAFLREKQPAQFEKARPEVEFAATLEPDADYLAVARTLLTDAATLAYNGIGYDLPERVAAALAKGDLPANTRVVATTEAAEAAEAAAPVETQAAAPAEKASKPRGRPKKNQVADDIPDETPAAPAEAPAAAASDDIPDNIRNNPEDRRNPDDDIPGEDAAPAAEKAAPAEATMTPDELFNYIQAAVKGGEITPQTIKQLQREHQFTRVKDLEPERVSEIKKVIDAAIKAGKIKKS